MARLRVRRRSASLDPGIMICVLVFVMFGFELLAPVWGWLSGIVFGALALLVWFGGAGQRLNDLHQWQSRSNMLALQPREFEDHVARTFKALGYETKITGTVGDQGLDVIAVRGKERVGIQCKRWNYPAGNGAVQETFTGKTHYGCNRAILVALGGFTRSAQTVACSTKVELLDGAAYASLFHKASASVPQRSVWTVLPQWKTVLSAIACGAISFVSFAIAVLHV